MDHWVSLLLTRLAALGNKKPRVAGRGSPNFEGLSSDLAMAFAHVVRHHASRAQRIVRPVSDELRD
jgi:hypothetical protein